MTQYNTNADFSTDATGTVSNCHTGNATTITGFTAQSPTGAFDSLRQATITAGGTVGAKYVSLTDTGLGAGTQLLSQNGPGLVGAATDTEILFHFRFATLQTDTPYGVIRSTASGTFAYGLQATDLVGNWQLLFYHGATPWSGVGSVINKGLVANTWYWARIRVTAAGAWSWKIWSGAFSAEPGFDVTAASETSQTSGYVGVGAIKTTEMPVDYDWFSAATLGDTAPGPSVTAPAPASYYLSNDTYV